MEVHKHPHHVTHKKKWSEYLLEFFMLFLAVFLGFVAENVREHVAERAKEKDYIESFISDLKSDTANIRRGITGIFMQAKKMDSLQAMLFTNNKSDSAIKRLYKLGFYVVNEYAIRFNQRTLNQLISSGNMRLLKPNVSDSIMQYNEIITVMDEQSKLYLDAIMKCIDLRFEVYNISYIRFKISNDTIVGLNNTDWKNMQMATTDPKTLSRFDVSVEAAKVLGESYLYMLRNMRTQSTSLIRFLKKEYHLDKE